MKGKVIYWVRADNEKQFLTLKTKPKTVRHIGVYGDCLVTNIGELQLVYQFLLSDPNEKYWNGFFGWVRTRSLWDSERVDKDICLMDLDAIGYDEEYNEFAFIFSF